MTDYLDTVRRSPWVLLILRFILGGVFLYAAIPKILDPAAFALDVQNYRLLPVQLTNLAAILLPWLELLCGLSLILGIYYRSAALILATLNLVFIFALASALYRGLDITCGCFNVGSDVSIMRIVEDLLFLAISLQLLFSSEERFALLKTGGRLS